MGQFRISGPARNDLTHILATSAERWGTDSRRRYASFLALAMRHVANAPESRMTRQREDLFPKLRSFHTRHFRVSDPNLKVSAPVHVIYFRVVATDKIEILRVLHERMDPTRHFD